jgi:hypothetical protein
MVVQSHFIVSGPPVKENNLYYTSIIPGQIQPHAVVLRIDDILPLVSVAPMSIDAFSSIGVPIFWGTSQNTPVVTIF